MSSTSPSIASDARQMRATVTPAASSPAASGGHEAGSVRTITWPPPTSRNPRATRRAARSGGRAVRGRGPDVGLPRVEGEHRHRLVEASVERVRARRPADADHAVPERIRVPRVVQDERVAEVTDDAARDRVRHRLVPLEAAGRRVVEADGSDHGSTIAAGRWAARQAKPGRCRRAYRRHETRAAHPPSRARARTGDDPMTTRFRLGVLVATAALALAACSSSGSTAAPASQRRRVARAPRHRRLPRPRPRPPPAAKGRGPARRPRSRTSRSPRASASRRASRSPGPMPTARTTRSRSTTGRATRRSTPGRP